LFITLNLLYAIYLYNQKIDAPSANYANNLTTAVVLFYKLS